MTTTTIIAVTLAVAVFVLVIVCIVYFRWFSPHEEEEEPWNRKSIDLDDILKPNLPLYDTSQVATETMQPKLLLAHDENERLSHKELFPHQGPGASKEPEGQPSFHTQNTLDRDERESKFTETTVGLFYDEFDKAQAETLKNAEDSDDDIEV